MKRGNNDKYDEMANIYPKNWCTPGGGTRKTHVDKGGERAALNWCPASPCRGAHGMGWGAPVCTVPAAALPPSDQRTLLLDTCPQNRA